MDSGVKTFICNLMNYKQLQFMWSSRQLSPDRICAGLVPDYMLGSLKEKGIYDYSSFVKKPNSWEISALVYSPILGDIFQYLVVQQAAQLSVPLHNLRLVILLKKPEGQAIVTPDGQIDASKKSHSLEPFFIKLINFELFGANYDF